MGPYKIGLVILNRSLTNVWNRRSDTPAMAADGHLPAFRVGAVSPWRTVVTVVPLHLDVQRVGLVISSIRQVVSGTFPVGAHQDVRIGFRFEIRRKKDTA